MKIDCYPSTSFQGRRGDVRNYWLGIKVIGSDRWINKDGVGGAGGGSLLEAWLGSWRENPACLVCRNRKLLDSGVGKWAIRVASGSSVTKLPSPALLLRACYWQCSCRVLCVFISGIEAQLGIDPFCVTRMGSNR